MQFFFCFVPTDIDIARSSFQVQAQLFIVAVSITPPTPSLCQMDPDIGEIVVWMGVVYNANVAKCRLLTYR